MRATIKAARPACHICGKPIDYTLASPHPDSFVIDHVIPLAKGGEDALSNVRAAHRHPRLQQHQARPSRGPDRPHVRFPRLTQPRPAGRHTRSVRHASEVTSRQARPQGGHPHHRVLLDLRG
ncbi:HNH endonuclease [Plantibacter auratus]|uniref:HNH endonuclease n=1 Tax=Plantibacter auratus TaxID=272914 RepID=UPI003D34FE78